MRRFGALYAVAALATLAVGCGGDGADSSAGSPDGPPATQTTQQEAATERSGESAAADRTANGNRATKGEARERPRDREQDLSPEEAIRRAIEGFLASGDAALVCRRTVTDRFLREAYGDRRGCEDAQGAGSAARSVDIKQIDVESGRAVAVPKGGPSGGDRLEIELARDGGEWMIDRIASDVPVGP